MRIMLALSLTFLVCSVAAGAEKPIPQDAARMEALFHERLEWNHRTLQGAYDRVGRRDPRWDDRARNALDLVARKASDQYEPLITDADLYNAAKQAVDAGCDDPLILYFYGLTSRVANPGLQEYTKSVKTASDAMQKSGYPPIRRAYALLTLVDVKTLKENFTADERKGAERELNAVLDLLPKSIAEDPRGESWDFQWHGIIKSVIAIHRKLSGDHKAAFDRVDARLAKLKGIEALRLTAKGNFFVNWAWEARGGGYASTVTEEMNRDFNARLGEAREALEQAWKLNPVGTTIPNLMLTIETGNGGGDREAMEEWFERAMRADGNDHWACSSKLNWLDPKWYGDENGEEMVAFGRACAATKNWQCGLILLALDAHYRRYTRMDPSDWKGYLEDPEVWADFATVYPEHLKHRPNDHVARSKYAVSCYISKHYREAHEQFQILGDNLTEWRTGPRWPLETLTQFRRAAAQLAAKPTK